MTKEHDPTKAIVTKRPSWEERLRHVQRQYPSTERGTWASALEDYALMGNLVRMLIQVGAETPTTIGVPGPRPMPAIKEGMDQLRALMGMHYTCMPFNVALRFLVLDRQWTLSTLAERSGVSRSQLHRLMAGAVKPSGGEIEAVARALGKPPEWFAEYRVAAVCALFSDWLTAAPDASAAILRQIRMAPVGPSRPANVPGARPLSRLPR